MQCILITLNVIPQNLRSQFTVINDIMIGNPYNYLQELYKNIPNRVNETMWMLVNRNLLELYLLISSTFQHRNIVRIVDVGRQIFPFVNLIRWNTNVPFQNDVVYFIMLTHLVLTEIHFSQQVILQKSGSFQYPRVQLTSF